MQAIQEENEMEFDKHGSPVAKTREMHIQVGASLMENMFDRHDLTDEAGSPASRFTTFDILNKPDEVLSPS
jgi:hypothetical protein